MKEKPCSFKKGLNNSVQSSFSRVVIILFSGDADLFLLASMILLLRDSVIP
jgi:hypothetical protein